MKAAEHGAISLVAGGSLWLALDSLAAGASCLLVGLLLDVDHLVDYLLHRPRTNTLSDLVDVCENCLLHKVILPLHSWELLGMTILATVMLPGHRLMLSGIVIGLGSHLLADQLSNPVTVRAYFFVHRCRQGFRRSAFFDPRAIEKRRRRDV